MKDVCAVTCNREGRRWDELYMGILREEWMELNHESIPAADVSTSK